jgi:FAD/FMN-containing dehydrogenase
MAVVADAAQSLRRSLSGDVIIPGDPGYDEVRRVHNGLIDKRPAVLARCLGTADVVDAVSAGREHALEISVRGGGHNVTGRAVTDGGLMVDLSRMKGVHVDPRRRTVRAQGGVIWREYNRAAGVFGLATTGGVVSTTGVAGLTLGGGIGWLMGTHGIAIDNLISAEVVLASGHVATASAEDDSELFWAIRGGGGNFGVVTSFEFRARPLATVLGGRVVYPLSAAASVFASLTELAGALPDELTIMVSLRMPPDGEGPKTCRVTVCHAGKDPGQAEAEVRPVRTLGSPIVEELARMPYPVMNTLLDPVFPRGT